MLTQEGCLTRRKRLWDAVDDELEWLLIADPRHVLYLANFWVQPLSFSGGERGLLLLERDGDATLFGDNFALRSSATEPYVDREVVETWYDHKHSVINRDHALQTAVGSVGKRLKGRPGAVEAEWLPVGALDILGLDEESRHRVAIHNLGSSIRELRRQKEPDEIEHLRLCMKAGDAGHARAREVIRPGISELDVYREVQSAAIAAAGRPGLVYGDFRAASAQTPKLGGLPTDHVLQDGEMFILDYSVVLEGYRSDFTNTIGVGKMSDQQEMIFRLCEAALQAGEDFLKAGVAAKEVYATVTQPLDEAGYGPLGHHAGHGLGLAHPESPILVPDSEDVLLAGDVVTLEPGLYIEGIGGVRIENNYLITETGAEKLNDHLIALQ